MLAAGDGGGHGLVQPTASVASTLRQIQARDCRGGLGNWGSGLVGAVCDTERVARPYS